MAPKAKAKAKTTKVVAKKSTKSKKKLAATSNPCCPVIRTSCHPTYTYKKVEKYVGDEVFHEKEKVTGPAKCSVTVGKKVYKNLSTDGMKAQVAESSKALADKRCVALVENVQEKTAEKIAERAALAALKAKASADKDAWRWEGR